MLLHLYYIIRKLIKQPDSISIALFTDLSELFALELRIIFLSIWIPYFK